jgi:Ribosomal protein L11, N-terminal domain
MLSSKVKDKGSSPFPPALNIFFFMRINLNFEYNKLNLKEITVLIPKYHANMVSFLTPILGLYGINVKEFINDFEQKTKFMEYDVIIPTKVKISKIKTFEIFIKTPYVVPILSQVESFSLTKPDINVLTFYKLSLIKSIFASSQLFNLQKRIYVSIRKYISLVIKITSSVSVLSLDLNLISFSSKIRQIKKNLNSLLLYKTVVYNRYGVFLNFNNVNNTYIDYLKNSLSIFHLGLIKVNPKMLNIFSFKSYFAGQNYYLFSHNLSYLHTFLKQMSATIFSSNMFPIFYRIGSNLLNTNFLKLYVIQYSHFRKLDVFTIILKLLHRSLKLLNYTQLRLLKILKYNANLSSNI